MPLTTMKDLLLNQLNELYAAEVHSTQLLPKLARAAGDPKLAASLRSHAKESEQHLTRLEEVFEELGLTPRSPTGSESNGMRGLSADCLRLAQMDEAEPHVRDAALIAAAQHVEHDEIAGYGCARTWAGLLGYDSAAARLQRTLDEERRSDFELTRLSESLNRTALAAATA